MIIKHHTGLLSIVSPIQVHTARMIIPKPLCHHVTITFKYNSSQSHPDQVAWLGTGVRSIAIVHGFGTIL